MRRYHLALFASMMILSGNIYAEQKAPSGIWLDHSSMTELKLPATGDITDLLLDFEYPANILPRAFLMDLNGDGVEDYLIESYTSLCGTGGCPYALIDGKTSKRIGDFFGSPILVLDQKINGFPVIQSYGHMNADSGNFVISVFDGKQYQTISNIFLSGQSGTDLFKGLDGFRKIRTTKDKKNR